MLGRTLPFVPRFRRRLEIPGGRKEGQAVKMRLGVLGKRDLP